MRNEHVRLFIRNKQTHFKHLENWKGKSKAIHKVSKVVFIKPWNGVTYTCAYTHESPFCGMH